MSATRPQSIMVTFYCDYFGEYEVIRSTWLITILKPFTRAIFWRFNLVNILRTVEAAKLSGPAAASRVAGQTLAWGPKDGLVYHLCASLGSNELILPHQIQKKPCNSCRHSYLSVTTPDKFLLMHNIRYTLDLPTIWKLYNFESPRTLLSICGNPS